MNTGSLINKLVTESKQPVPEVGMGATICYWTDRNAATVVAVSESGKQVTVQRDKATRKDNNGMSDCQQYEYERDPNGRLSVFTLRRNGKWVDKGSPMNSGACLSLGRRDEHYDYSF